MRVATAHPNRLITLTVDPKRYLSPREAYDETRRKVGDLSKLLRKKLGSFDYLRVLEVTKKGWPHYHFVARCPFIAQADLSLMWAHLAGAPIVDIRALSDTEGAYAYVMKYLSKQAYVPWTNRRVSWSKNFFPKTDPSKPEPWRLNLKERHNQHPAEWLMDNGRGETIERLTPTCWRFVFPNEENTNGQD